MMRRPAAGTVHDVASQLGLDADAVELQTDGEPAAKARAHGSAAVVDGGAVHVDSEGWQAESQLGRHLIAHELVHLAQQRLPGDGSLGAAEREADRMANAYVAGAAIGPATMPLAASAQPTWIPPGQTVDDHPDQRQLSDQGFVVSDAGAIRIERLWFEANSDGASRLLAAARASVLDAMAQTSRFGYVSQLGPDERATAIANISIVVTPGAWTEEGTAALNIHQSVYKWIGLPPGQVLQWAFIPGASGYRGQCVIAMDAVAIDGNTVSPTRALMVEVVDALEQAVHMEMLPSMRARVIADRVFVGGSHDTSGLALLIGLSRDDMALLFGESNWATHEQRLQSGEVSTTADPVDGGLTLDDTLNEADRAFVNRFLSEISAGSGEGSSDLYVGPSLVAVMREIDGADPAKRAAIVARLRGEGAAAESAPSGAALSAQLLRNVINAVELDAEYERLGIDAEPSSDRRPFQFPVEGFIQNNSDLLFTGKKASFSFVTTSRGDTLAIPWVHVRWVIRRPATADQREETVDSGSSSHRDYATEAPDPYVYRFDQTGQYEINALVDHAFFLPNSFSIDVEVKSEGERMFELENRVFGAGPFGDPDRTEYGYEFSDASWTDAHDEGERVRGASPIECGPGIAELPTGTDRIDQRIAQLEAWVAAPGTSEDAAGWASAQLEMLRGARENVEEALEDGATPLAAQAVYLSRTERAGSQEVQLSVTARREGEEWHVQIVDITQAYDDRASVFSETRGNLEAAIEAAFVELGKSYPDGQMSIRVETIGEDGTATGHYLGFSVDCNSTWEDIRTTVWEPTVQVVVNVAGAVLMIFVPVTASFVMPALIAYNAVETIGTMADYAARDALETEDIAVGIGQLAVDLIPYAGRASRLVSVGGRTYHVIEGLSEAGDALLLSAGAVEEVDAIRAGVVTQAAQLHAQIQELEQQNASDPRLDSMRARLTRLETQAREAWATALGQIAFNQGLMRASMRAMHGVDAARRQRVEQSHVALDAAVGERGMQPVRAEDMPHLARTMGVAADVDTSLGAGVRVTFEVGALGSARNIRLRVGPDAPLTAVRAHAATVDSLRCYSGVTEGLRDLLSRVRAEGGAEPRLRLGDRGYAAKLELEKLPRVIEAFEAQLAGENLSPDTRQLIEANIISLRSQIDEHAAALDSAVPGLGYIASEGVPASMLRDTGQSTTLPIPAERAATPRHQELRARRGSDSAVLSEWPSGWRARDEAEFRYGPAAIDDLPDGHYWSRHQGAPVLVRERIYGADGDEVPRQRFVNGQFEEVADGVVRARRTDVTEDFHAPPEVSREIEELLVSRDQARQRRDAAASELEQLAAGLDIDGTDLRNIDGQLRALRAEHAGDASMLARIDEVEAARSRRASASHDVSSASAELGQQMAAEYVRSTYPSAELVYGGPGSRIRSGDFDALWRVPGAGADGADLILVIEAKGGQGRLGTRLVGDDRHEQGTRGHMGGIAEVMRRDESLTEHQLAIVEEIGLASRLASSSDVQYLLIHTRLQSSGTLGRTSVDRFEHDVD